MDSTDETQYKRRASDGKIQHWLSLSLALVVAVGGTLGFTFNVYESIRSQLVELSALKPTLDAHIRADSDLQRICQARVDYLERRLDSLTTATRANTAATADSNTGDATRTADLERRLKALEQKQ